MTKKSLLLGSAAAVLLFTGCATNINMSDYPNKVRQVYQVPEVCEAEYKKLKEVPKVAVLPFTNNSSLEKLILLQKMQMQAIKQHLLQV